MVSSIWLLSLFLGQALASISGNQYVDTVINSALQNVLRNEKLDPTHLRDFTFDYKDKTFIGKVSGKAEYSEGTLTSLSKVRRFSECDGPRNISSNTVINCTLVFRSLETSHKGKVKYGVLPKVTINAKGSVLSVQVNVGIVKSVNDRSPKVKTFLIRSPGSINTTFTGLGPLNKHMNVLEENYKRVVGAEVISVINNRFQYALNLAVASVPMPIR